MSQTSLILHYKIWTQWYERRRHIRWNFQLHLKIVILPGDLSQVGNHTEICQLIYISKKWKCQIFKSSISEKNAILLRNIPNLYWICVFCFLIFARWEGIWYLCILCKECWRRRICITDPPWSLGEWIWIQAVHLWPRQSAWGK